MQTNSLHVLTTHLMRDLQVPLGAKDNKGETPMHAAAEIGVKRFGSTSHCWTTTVSFLGA